MSKKKPEPPKLPPKQHTIISLKGSVEFRDWLAVVSEKSRIPASVIVELALTKWARDNGYSEPPKR